MIDVTIIADTKELNFHDVGVEIEESKNKYLITVTPNKQEIKAPAYFKDNTKVLADIIRTSYTPKENIESVKEKFERLANQWKEETNLSSSISEMAMHPAYQKIIGMGKVVIPLILNELSKKPDQWFWALSAITGEEPDLPYRSRVKDMALAWLRWGKERGYVD